MNVRVCTYVMFQIAMTVLFTAEIAFESHGTVAKSNRIYQKLQKLWYYLFHCIAENVMPFKEKSVNSVLV